MNEFFNWLINAPVWLQAPLVLLVLLPVCAALAAGVVWLGSAVVPPSDSERQLLWEGIGEDNLGEPRQGDSKVGREMD